ncbi:MAG TPA: TetR/AcrR family transcriptional regulator [Patescibacteria group bacterium]|nr:TetR/AcrR family transcriptional regulator [Patescibacteria group bacterium]
MIPRREQKQETRARILASAAEALRSRGLAASSVAEVMAGAGLTVGGFYAHFDNKDALMLEALDRVFAQRRELLFGLIQPGTPAAQRKQAARAYLSRQHRDMDEHCCPLPAILSELPKQPQAFRASLETHLTSLLKAMVAGEPDRDAARQTALADLAMMIGALSLARALGPTPFSDELLAASKAAIR